MNEKTKKNSAGILTAVLVAVSLSFLHSCIGGQGHEDDIVLETSTFKLTVGKDAVARSLVIKGTGGEMLLKGTEMPLFSVTQERPFNNETKLEHPNTRTTYKADRLAWDGERLTVGFETAPYEAVVKVDADDGYLKFTLEDFICKPEDYGYLSMDLPPVAEFRILQLPVKARAHFGEWLNCMWDETTAGTRTGPMATSSRPTFIPGRNSAEVPLRSSPQAAKSRSSTPWTDSKPTWTFPEASGAGAPRC